MAELWAAGGDLNWDCLFVLPFWLQSWWSTLGGQGTPLLRGVRQGDRLIGIAPLLLEGGTARFLGSTDVCDYQDFVVAPDRGGEFFGALLEHLRGEGVHQLDLGAVRGESAVLTQLAPLARGLGYGFSCEPEDTAIELALPRHWDEFLTDLGAKQRHEVRRKLRRLEEAGPVRYRRADSQGSLPQEIEAFLDLFRASRADKARFLTEGRCEFFRRLMDAAAREGLLNLAFLELSGAPAAAVLCFDYRGTTYLYNNGSDPRFRFLSVGLLSKVFSMQDSIRRGRSTYDLLKGAETYKLRLGGREVPLFRCRVDLR